MLLVFKPCWTSQSLISHSLCAQTPHSDVTLPNSRALIAEQTATKLMVRSASYSDGRADVEQTDGYVPQCGVVNKLYCGNFVNEFQDL